MFLRAVHFKPGVSIVLGGKYSHAQFWDLEKFPDVLVERQDNGDYCFITPWDGRIRRVRADAVAWTLEEPPGTEHDKLKPALAKRDEARRMYQEKFGKREPIKGTEQKR